MADPRIRRAQALLEGLFTYALTTHRPEYVEAHKAKFPMIEPPMKPIPETPWQDFMEEFIFERPLKGGPIVTRYLESHPNLSRQEQKLLRSWSWPVRGFFKIRTAGGKPAAFSLINEKTYPLDTGDLPLTEGTYLVGRLFHVGDGDHYPGANSTIPADDAQRGPAILSTALQIQSITPHMAFFDNPEKRDLSRRLTEARYDFFLTLFGTDEKVGTGEAIAEDFERFRSEWAARNTTPALHPDMADAVPEVIAEADDVGMVMHRRFGVGLMRGYAAFLRVCERGFENKADREVFEVYVASLEQAPPAWEKALDRFPEGTSKALREYRGEEGGEEILASIRALLDAPETLPTIIAVLDPELAAAIPPLPTTREAGEGDASE
ncbi:MAG: hypothetical protein ACYS47_07675 [Planctomycetota bacterium]|jgi:hypothetical protein